MKQRVLLNAVLGTACALTGLTASAADEVARVISSTAIMQQVGVPRQACATYSTPGMAPSCSTQTVYESRAVGYHVIYELAGKRYSVQLPQDPGATLRLQGTRGEPVVASAPPAPAIAPAPAAPARSAPRASREIASVEPEDSFADAPLPPDWVAAQSGTYLPPVQVSYAYPVYVSRPGYAYYDAPYYWGPTLGIGLVGGYYLGRHHRHGHGHWHGRRR